MQVIVTARSNLEMTICVCRAKSTAVCLSHAFASSTQRLRNDLLTAMRNIYLAKEEKMLPFGRDS